jgi:hypothetical protein
MTTGVIAIADVIMEVAAAAVVATFTSANVVEVSTTRSSFPILSIPFDADIRRIKTTTMMAKARAIHDHDRSLHQEVD